MLKLRTNCPILFLLKTGIPQAYDENIIANVLQAEDASASMGFVLKNGDGGALTNVTLTSYAINVGESKRWRNMVRRMYGLHHCRWELVLIL